MLKKLLAPRTLFAACLILLIGIAFNWLYAYVDVYETAQTRVPDFVEDVPPSTSQRILAAGWPFKFLLKVEYEQAPAYVVFSIGRLVGDLVVWLALATFVVIYERRLTRALGSGSGKPGRRLSIVDLLTLTLLVACIITYARVLESASASEAAMVNEVSQSGGFARQTVFLPSPLAAFTQRFQSQLFSYHRVTELTLVEPTDEQVRKAMSFPYLRKLYLGGGSYDLRILDNLASKPLLRELRISGRRLDVQTVAAIGAVKQLVALNLMRTNITSSGIHSLGSMPRLKVLNLIHTDIDVSQIDHVPCADSLEQLLLPRPSKGSASHLRLEGWPKLQKLVVNEYDQPLNPQAMTVEIRDLASLKAISLDSLQLVELTLSSLPALEEVKPEQVQWQSRAPAAKGVPDGLWLKSLQLEKTPKLQQLDVYATDLETCEFRDPNEMNLRLTASRRRLDLTDSESASSGEGTIPPAKIANWLHSFTDDAGPLQLELRSMQLQQIDFDPIAANSRIKRLAFNHSQVNASQLVKLAKMKSLQELDLSGCDVNGNALSQVLSKLPHLAMIACDRDRLGRLRLRDLPNLVQLFGPPTQAEEIAHSNSLMSVDLMSRTDAIQLVELPLLRESINLPSGVVFIHLENIPSLTGLSVAGPWPGQGILKGVRDLEYLSVGGRNITDEILDAVIRCPNLTRLTLAYTSISSGALAKLNTLKRLTSLTVSGSQVNDDALKGIAELNDLRDLWLDDTAVTDVGLGILSKMTKLQSLSLHRTNVTADGLRQLSSLTDLRRLAIGNRRLNKAEIAAVCSIASLRVLDLSGSTFTSDALIPLVQSTPVSLELVGLRHATLDDGHLRQFALRLPVLLDVDPTELSLELRNELTSLLKIGKPSEFRDIEIRPYDSLPLLLPSEKRKHRPGEVDPRFFAPATAL